MEIFMLIFLSMGLAMDASAVAMSNGICYPYLSKKKAIFIALVFGIFQGVMPLTGYFFGTIIKSFVELVGNWFAFIILTIIGLNMIVDSIKEMRHPDSYCPKERLSVRDIMIQGLATSIDALVVGIALTTIETNIIFSALIISIITFLCCTLSVVIGKKFGSVLKDKAPLLGGLILIVIAIRFLIDLF